MKHTLTLIAIVLSSLSLSAQWKVGPKASFGTITQGAETFRVLPSQESGLYDLEFVSGSSVYSAGLMAYRDLGPFFLQTEALITNYSLDFRLDNFKNLDLSSPVYTEEYFILEVPFVAGVNIKDHIKVGVGPVAEILADKNSQFNAQDNYIDTTAPIEYGFQALIGFTTGVLHIDLKYVNKFSGISDSFNFGTDDIKLNNSANRLSLSVGVAF